jgi:hypothetical protein
LHYRVYRLNSAGRILSGEWIAAENDHEARGLARQLCEPGTRTLELWQGAQRLAVMACDADAAPDAA